MLIAVSTPADNERGPLYMQQVFDALHRERSPVSFEFGRHAQTVSLYCRFPARLGRSLETQLRSAYPDMRLTHLGDDALAVPPGYRRRSVRLRVSSSLYAIKSWEDFFDNDTRTLADPISGLLATLASDDVRTHIVIRTRPASLLRRVLVAVGRTVRNRRHLDKPKPAGHLFAVSLHLSVAAPRHNRRFARHKLREMAGAFGRYANPPFAVFRRVLIWPRRCLLCSTELATLWHPPTGTVRTDKLETTPHRLLEPPAVIPTRESEAGVAVLGRVAFHGRDQEFGIRTDDRRRHLFIVGKTGMGKSTLLQNLASSDIDAGRGVALIDPHGDLATAVAAAVPRRRTNDVVLFDAGDRSHPIAFNPLACRTVEQRPLVVSGIVSAFRKLYAESWGPRLEHILRNALLVLVERKGTTLVSLMRMLSDTAYRSQLVCQTSDPIVRAFWQSEFAGWKPQLRAEAVAPIQNKVGQFMSHPIPRSILGQTGSRVDLRDIMDKGRILIVNLSKGQIGEDASSMLGSLFVTKLQIDAMGRADVPEERRRDFFAYVDEFQNFATESFATVLSEARKYRLCLTLANQYLDQMDVATLHAVFGNVGSMLAFQVGARDAEPLAEQFGGDLTPVDLMALPKYTAYARLLIGGMPSRPFSMQTLRRQQTDGRGRLATIRRTSRHRYARLASHVQREIDSAFTVV